MINKAIVHYREDIDLQNLIDFGQKEVRTKYKIQNSYAIRTILSLLSGLIVASHKHLTCLALTSIFASTVWLLWWCHIHRLVPEHVLRLQAEQPQQGALLRPLLLLHHAPKQGLLHHKTLPIFIFYLHLFTDLSFDSKFAGGYQHHVWTRHAGVGVH